MYETNTLINNGPNMLSGEGGARPLLNAKYSLKKRDFGQNFELAPRDVAATFFWTGLLPSPTHAIHIIKICQLAKMKCDDQKKGAYVSIFTKFLTVLPTFPVKFANMIGGGRSPLKPPQTPFLLAPSPLINFKNIVFFQSSSDNFLFCVSPLKTFPPLTQPICVPTLKYK